MTEEERTMRKALIAAVAVVATVASSATATAAPSDPVNTNPNALVFPITCPGYNDDNPFLIWAPNGTQHLAKGHLNLVGQPLDVDVPVGVQKKAPGNKTIECVGPQGITVHILVTGKPAD
jgi:hypothetical protein